VRKHSHCDCHNDVSGCKWRFLPSLKEIEPLLALTADQMRRINQAVQVHTSTAAYHMDELSPGSVDDVVLPHMRDISYDSSTTIFIFTSPQFIAENESFCQSILSCQNQKTLRRIVIDEVHLYAMYGRSFHIQIRQLLSDLIRSFTHHFGKDTRKMCRNRTISVNKSSIAYTTKCNPSQTITITDATKH